MTVIPGYVFLTVSQYEQEVEYTKQRGTKNPESGEPTIELYREAATVGLFAEATANDLADLWTEHRAKTYYQDGLAARERAAKMYALATEVHAFVVGRSSQGHECICDR